MQDVLDSFLWIELVYRHLVLGSQVSLDSHGGLLCLTIFRVVAASSEISGQISRISEQMFGDSKEMSKDSNPCA
jgi:hypothetical protein